GPAHLRLLHDLGSPHDARPPGRARALRRPRRPRRVLGPVPAVPHQRPALVALRLRAPRPRHRSAAPGHAPRPAGGVRPEARRKRSLVFAVFILVLGAFSGRGVRAFCGFYVGKADSKLFNQASQVALVREGDHTVLTMANDFQGDPKEFALVVPVPTFIERRQIAVVDKVLLDHLDAFTAPRLVEYFDEDPCAPREL